MPSEKRLSSNSKGFNKLDMHKPFFIVALILILWLFSVEFVYAQKLIDPARQNPYTRIFVDTDNFDASYLEELEQIYLKM